MNNFLQNNGIVSGAPTRQETALARTNNIIKDGPEAMDKDFGDNFVDDVAKANGSKVFVGGRGLNFRNEGNESVGYGGVKMARKEG